MEFSEVVRRRRMIRRFAADRPVPAETVGSLLTAARRAPSAGFTQGVSFLVVTSADDRDAFWALTGGPDRPDAWLRGMRTAPALVLVWTSEDAYRRRYAEPDKAAARARHRAAATGDGSAEPGLPWSVPFWFVDAGMAVQALLYAAVDAGLGAAFVGLPEPALPGLRDRFGVPADQLPVGLVAIGYPDEAATGPTGPTGSRRPRKPAGEVVHHGHWSDGSASGPAQL